MSELEAMELQLAEVEQIQFPASLDLLDDREVWIADTGASNHSTPYKFGSINEQPSDVLAQGATGKPVAPTCEVDIPVTACDKFRNEKARIALTEVGHMADRR